MEAQTIILDSSTVSLAEIASRRILTPHRGSSREFCLVAVQLTQETGLRCRANLTCAHSMCPREGFTEQKASPTATTCVHPRSPVPWVFSGRPRRPRCVLYPLSVVHTLRDPVPLEGFQGGWHLCAASAKRRRGLSHWRKGLHLSHGENVYVARQMEARS